MILHYTDARGLRERTPMRRLGSLFDSAGEGNPDFVPGQTPELARFDGVLATNDPFHFLIWARWVDDDGEFQSGARWVEGRLELTEGGVSSRMGTPGGVPVAWSHEVYWSGAVGFVDEMRVRGGRLEGTLAVSSRELTKYMVGSTDDLERGVNSGLSIGFSWPEEPEYEMRDGTREDPDRMTYGSIHVWEVSLVPIPALAGAGITGRRA